MRCIYCFFKDKFQNDIKSKNRQSKFELELREYKKNFLKNLGEVCSCKECMNRHEFNENVVEYLDELCIDVKSKKEYIDEVFDEIIKIYMQYILQNHIKAYIGLIEFLRKYSNNYTTINTAQMCKPMFRVRPLGSYDKNNIREYFHIPFSERYNVGNQRYSMAGIPTSYMAESLQIALDETEKNIEEVNVALFIPRYSYFYGKGMYDVSNVISENLDAIISETYQEAKIKYDNNFSTFRKGNIDKTIADYILYQVLQFPTNPTTKGVFIQEYVLPQMMMEMVQNEDCYIGMQYQTSKFREYPNEIELRKVPNLNYCFFIPFTEEHKYSENLLKNFFYVIYDEKDEEIEYKKLQLKIDLCYQHCRETQSRSFVVDEYFHYITQVKMYLENMRLIDPTHSDSKVDKVEKQLFFKYLEIIDKIISNPEQNNLIKH